MKNVPRTLALQAVNTCQRLFKGEEPDVISTWCENTSR